MRILTFDIGGTAIKIGVVSENGDIVEKKEIETKAKEGGEALLSRIFNKIEGYKSIDKIGISTAGQIDTRLGSVIYATGNLPGWTGMKIKERIEKRFSIEASVENDVNCAALGEAYFGAGRGYMDFLCLTIGTGIGGAIIQNGFVYHGSTGSAGEFGHMITHGGGIPCNCGGRGCYEKYASTTALIDAVKAFDPNQSNINGRQIFEKALNGDSDYIGIVDSWITEILIGLTGIIHSLNPSLIVMGGGIMEQEYIINKLNSNINDYVMPNFRGVMLKKAVLGNDAGLLGASILHKLQ